MLSTLEKWITYVRISQSLSLTFSIAEEQFIWASTLSCKVPRWIILRMRRSLSIWYRCVRSIMPKLLKMVGHRSSDVSFMFVHVHFEVSIIFGNEKFASNFVTLTLWSVITSQLHGCSWSLCFRIRRNSFNNQKGYSGQIWINLLKIHSFHNLFEWKLSIIELVPFIRTVMLKSL